MAQRRVELVGEFVAGPAAAGAFGASALNHEVGNHAVEDQTVIEGLAGFGAFGEIDEILYRIGRFVVEKFDFEAAFGGIENRVGFSSHEPIVALAVKPRPPVVLYSDELCSLAARVASSSARLLSSCEAWPLVQTHVVLWRPFCSSSSSHRSRLTTGFLSAVSQPR